MDDKITLDSTVRSQESNVSDDTSKNSIKTGDSKTDSCKNSKYSKDVLINKLNDTENNNSNNNNGKIIDNLQNEKLSNKKIYKNDTNIIMLTSLGQLIFGLVLITFGILVLIHGVSLGTSGAGLWAGMSALVAGSLGLVAALAESTSIINNKISSSSSSSGFSTAHLATTLVALGLANLSTIAAINSIVRDARSSEFNLYISSNVEDDNYDKINSSWSSLLASIGLLLSSLFELLIAGYTCIKLSPKLCSCLAKQSFDNDPDSQLEIIGTDIDVDIGKLKKKNMVHQWVIAQTHSPKNSLPPSSPSTRQAPFYIVHQPVMTLQPVVQTPYGAVPYTKYPGAYHLPAYGPIPMIPQLMPPLGRVPSMQMKKLQYRPLKKKHAINHHHHHPHHHNNNNNHDNDDDDSIKRKYNSREIKIQPKQMLSIGEDDDNNTRDLSLTYTGLDKKMSEEFISICMDPERKSRTSSNYGSEIDSSNAK